MSKPTSEAENPPKTTARQLLEQATARSAISICFVVAALGMVLITVGCLNGGLMFFSDQQIPMPALFIVLGAVQIVIFLPYAIILVLVRSLLRVIDETSNPETKSQETSRDAV